MLRHRYRTFPGEGYHSYEWCGVVDTEGQVVQTLTTSDMTLCPGYSPVDRKRVENALEIPSAGKDARRCAGQMNASKSRKRHPPHVGNRNWPAQFMIPQRRDCPNGVYIEDPTCRICPMHHALFELDLSESNFERTIFDFALVVLPNCERDRPTSTCGGRISRPEILTST